MYLLLKPTENMKNAYRIIEVDISDVILGQRNAPILRMDKEESLREENDFPYNQNFSYQKCKQNNCKSQDCRMTLNLCNTPSSGEESWLLENTYAASAMVRTVPR